MILTLLLGSNLGDSMFILSSARALIEERIGNIIRQTKVKITVPWGFISDNDFYNQILEVASLLSPLELLDIIEGIEEALGRKKNNLFSDQPRVYVDRLLDIDILYYGAMVYCDTRLQIPHPRIEERVFTLELLEELKSLK